MANSHPYEILIPHRAPSAAKAKGEMFNADESEFQAVKNSK